ncbi:lysophospholipid acyltransferase family protein [Spirochaeta cellobiosiphila]|uniref:lysophospholipid acyltransferase family protein n=1 Tax=Spirochaeta cellobiosiphila TaxID=504483 RepID=UPI0003FBCF8E|nr:lysophospholipid acyltransferase family protein [Spirochaeta cellobiosiphila]
MIKIINGIINFFLKCLCKIDDSDLVNLPLEGPYILAGNHINFLDVPLLYLSLQPRPIIGMAKAELWKVPVVKSLMKAWHVIPIKRGAADVGAMRKAMESLEEGAFFSLSPEGTRNKNGKLLKGRPGTVVIAEKSRVPIIPVVHWGGENLKYNMKRLRRTKITIKIGKPFIIDIQEEKMSQELRKKVVDEVMYQIAECLPEDYRGYYSDMSQKTTNYLKFV